GQEHQHHACGDRDEERDQMDPSPEEGPHGWSGFGHRRDGTAAPERLRRRGGMSPMRPMFFATPSEFRAWLEEHHATAKELLVGFHKKSSGKPSITWPEAVDEALCFGWIDSVRKRIDDTSYSNRFTPRTVRSTWSAVNIKRAEDLIERGRMRPAGRKAFKART